MAKQKRSRLCNWEADVLHTTTGRSRGQEFERETLAISKGAQEFEQGLLFGGFQLFEFLCDVLGLAVVTEDSVKERDGSAVVHETRMHADTPERSGADFVGGVVKFGNGEVFPGDLVHLFAVMLGHGLNDAVAGANIVKQEVAVGMKLLSAEGGRDGEGAAIEVCAGGSGRKRLNVAGITAHFVEYLRAQSGFGSLRNLGVARGSFRGTDEAREVVDIGVTVGADLVIRFRSRVAEVGDFVGLEAAGDAHLIEIGVRGEGKEAGLLVFPPETADAGLAGGFNDGNVEDLATDFVVLLALVFGEVHEGLIRDRFHKSIAQKVQRYAECSDRFRIRDALLNFRSGKSGIGADGTIVHERAALDDFRAASDENLRVHELTVGSRMSHPQFGHLAGAAGSGVLVALAAGLGVVERAETVVKRLSFVELCLIRSMSSVVHHAVGLIVETGGCFREWRCEEKNSDSQERNPDGELHEHLGAGS